MITDGVITRVRVNGMDKVIGIKLGGMGNMGGLDGVTIDDVKLKYVYILMALLSIN